MAKYDMNALKGNASAKNLLEKSMETVSGTDRIIEIPVDKIYPSPLNEGLPMEGIDELAESIKENGLLHEITVYDMEDGTYEFLSGHRRFEALKKNGATKIPCRVRPKETDALKRFEQHFDANAQTRDKDIRFKIAEFEHAMSLFSDTDIPVDEKMDRVSKLLSKNRTGYSKTQLYRLKALEKLDESILKLDKIGLSPYTMSLASAIPYNMQPELARRTVELYLEKQHADDASSDAKQAREQYITRNEFKKLIRQFKSETDYDKAETPKVTHRSFQVRLREAQGKYLEWFDKVKTQEDKDVALTEIDALEKELEEKRKMLNDMSF